MRFWDSSALMPIFVVEPASHLVRRWFEEDPRIAVWTLTRVELLSGLARRRRQRPDARALSTARDEILRRWDDWFEIALLEPVRRHAERLVEAHPLHAADALQIGAAFVAADNRPADLEFVTLDDRQANAAAQEGFPVLGSR